MNGGNVVTDQPAGGGSGPVTESGQIVVLPVSFQNIDGSATTFTDSGNFCFLVWSTAFNAHADVKPAISGAFTITSVQAILTGAVSNYSAEIEVLQAVLGTTSSSSPTLTDKAHLPYGQFSTGGALNIPVVDSSPVSSGDALYVKLFVAPAAGAVYLQGVIINFTRTITPGFA